MSIEDLKFKFNLLTLSIILIISKLKQLNVIVTVSYQYHAKISAKVRNAMKQKSDWMDIIGGVFEHLSEWSQHLVW